MRLMYWDKKSISFLRFFFIKLIVINKEFKKKKKCWLRRVERVKKRDEEEEEEKQKVQTHTRAHTHEIVSLKRNHNLKCCFTTKEIYL